MIVSTTPQLEGHPIKEYLGIVTGEVVSGANVIKDIKASFTDFFGGRSSTYEDVLQKAKEEALQEMKSRASSMGANAIVGVDFDYEVLGGGGSMLMVACSGTAVLVE